eukprot:gene15008-10730_t
MTIQQDTIVLERAIALYNDANYYNSQAGDLSRAKCKYEEALTFFWEFPEAHQNLANVMDQLGLSHEAVRHHRWSVQFGRTTAFKMDALANVVNLESRLQPLKKDILTQGIQDMEALLPIGQPLSASALVHLSIWYRRLGLLEPSLFYLEQATQVDPSYALAYMNIGNHYFVLEEYPTAIVHFERSLQVAQDPKTKELTHINLGQANRQLGRYKQSLQHFEEAIQSVPMGAHILRATYLSHILAVKSLGNLWHRYEEFEAELLDVILGLQGAQSLKRLAWNIEHAIDPYTVSLLRYVPAAVDRLVAHLVCPDTGGYMYPPIPSIQAMIDQPTGFSNNFSAVFPPTVAAATTTTPPLVRVGYLSYDWRSHPMGRLTASLVTPTTTTAPGAGAAADFCTAEATLQDRLTAPSGVDEATFQRAQERSFQWHEVIAPSISTAPSAVTATTSTLDRAEYLVRHLLTEPALWRRQSIVQLMQAIAGCQKEPAEPAEPLLTPRCVALQHDAHRWFETVAVQLSHPVARGLAMYLQQMAHAHWYHQVISYRSTTSTSTASPSSSSSSSANATETPVGQRLRRDVFPHIDWPCDTTWLPWYLQYPWQTRSWEEVQGFVYQLEPCWVTHWFPSVQNDDVYWGPRKRWYLSTFDDRRMPRWSTWSPVWRWRFQRFLTVYATERLLQQPQLQAKPQGGAPDETDHDHDHDHDEQQLLSTVRWLFTAFYVTPSPASYATSVTQLRAVLQAVFPHLVTSTTTTSTTEELATIAARPLTNLVAWMQQQQQQRQLPQQPPSQRYGPWTCLLGHVAMHVAQSVLPWTHTATSSSSSSSTMRLSTLPSPYLPAVRAAVKRELEDHRSGDSGDSGDSDSGSNRRRRAAMRQYAETHLTWRRSAAIVEDILRDLANVTDGP